MSECIKERKETWKAILLFLVILTILSSIVYYAILRLNPTSIYIGALMMCPALASIATLIIQKRSITELKWGLSRLKYLKLSYVIPVLYITIAYIIIWSLGLGDLFNEDKILDWRNELGIETSHPVIVVGVMMLLLAIVGVIKNIGSTLGEEIGWRGFFIFELRKIFSFTGVSLISGFIWSLWHWPIIMLIYKGSGYVVFHIIAFTIMIIGMSVILAYYTFKSNSLWPAALFHSVHNIYIQKFFTPLTVTNEKSTFWIDEYGLMIPLVVTVFAFYFWRKASIENL